MQISQLLRHKGREVATIDGSESVRTALGLLAEKGIGALVVSSDGRGIDGIVSERDVARGLHTHGAGLLAEPVSSVMTAQVHTCSPQMSVHDLAQTMTDHRVRHVPVVDGRRADRHRLDRRRRQGPAGRARGGAQAAGGLHPDPLSRTPSGPRLAGSGRDPGRGHGSLRAGRTVRRWTSVAWECSPGWAPTRCGDCSLSTSRCSSRPAGLEIVAHRVLWSLVFVGLLLTVLRRWSHVRALVTDRRRLLVLAGAAVLIAVNWLVFVYGVNSGHVVETSLGYFINPLVSVLLGVVVFSERLRPLQWVAVGIAAVAVAVLTIDYGRPPWIALTLAVTFGLYGVMKKIVRVEAAPGLFVETALVAIPAVVVLAVLHSGGDGTFANAGTGHALLLIELGSGHRDPAAAVRGRRPPDPAVDGRAPAVPDPADAAGDRRLRLRRAHAARAAGRFRHRLGGPGGVHRRQLRHARAGSRRPAAEIVPAGL